MPSKIEGYDELMAKLNRMSNPRRAMGRAMDTYLKWVQDKATDYPPATIANRPPGRNGYSWYVRNVGTRTRTGKTYKTSEQMSKRWQFEVKYIGYNVIGIIENLASYSDYVQGIKQVWFHANRGWKNLPKFLRASINVMVRFHKDEFDKELRK